LAFVVSPLVLAMEDAASRPAISAAMVEGL